MRTKATFLAGFGTGYVLGSRAGRARYDQIVRAAQSLRANPAVQSATSTLQTQATGALSTVKDKATSSISDKVSDKRPAWLGSPPRSSTGGAFADGTAPGSPSEASEPIAGSNGHVGG